MTRHLPECFSNSYFLYSPLLLLSLGRRDPSLAGYGVALEKLPLPLFPSTSRYSLQYIHPPYCPGMGQCMEPLLTDNYADKPKLRRRRPSQMWLRSFTSRRKRQQPCRLGRRAHRHPPGLSLLHPLRPLRFNKAQLSQAIPTRITAFVRAVARL